MSTPPDTETNVTRTTLPGPYAISQEVVKPKAETAPADKPANVIPMTPACSQPAEAQDSGYYGPDFPVTPEDHPVNYIANPNYIALRRLAARWMDTYKGSFEQGEFVGVKNIHSEMYSIGVITSGLEVHPMMMVQFPDPANKSGFQVMPSGGLVQNSRLLTAGEYIVVPIPYTHLRPQTGGTSVRSFRERIGGRTHSAHVTRRFRLEERIIKEEHWDGVIQRWLPGSCWGSDTVEILALGPAEDTADEGVASPS